MAGDFEDTTIEELLSWANGLGLCEFERVSSEVMGEGVGAKGGKEVSLRLFFSHYCESVPLHGGWRHVGVWIEDRRDGGYAGSVGGRVSWEQLEGDLTRAVDRLGLFSGQLSLF